MIRSIAEHYITNVTYVCFVHIVLYIALYPQHRGMVDENGDQFVAYFMPTQETLQKREDDKKIQIPYRDGEE